MRVIPHYILFFFLISCQSETKTPEAPVETAPAPEKTNMLLVGDWMVDSARHTHYHPNGDSELLGDSNIWSFGEDGSYKIDYEHSYSNSYKQFNDTVVIKFMLVDNSYKIIYLDNHAMHLSRFIHKTASGDSATIETYFSRIPN